MHRQDSSRIRKDFGSSLDDKKQFATLGASESI